MGGNNPGSSGSSSTQPLLNDQYQSTGVAPPPSPPIMSFSSPPGAPPAYQVPPPYANKFKGVPKELIDDVRSIQAELKKVGILPEHQARVCLVLDISYSMQNPNEFYYDEANEKPGPILTVVKQAVVTAMAFDDDQELDIFAFGNTANVNPYKATKDNFAAVIADQIIGEHPEVSMQSRTNYAAAMRAVRQHYFNDNGNKNTKKQDDVPVFMIFVTDGNHNMEEVAAAKQFRASSYEPIFCKIIALEGKEKSEFPFLKNIDKAPTLDDPYHKDPSKGKDQVQPQDCNYIDNANFVLLKDPSELTPAKLLCEYPQWLLQAQKERYGHVLLTADQKIDKKIVKDGMQDADRVGEHNPKRCCNLI